uniref:Acetolactate synthase n=1 Tax=Polytomella parva TaxID=51329 RepID=A0A7S0YXN6_9CHLO|nr:acetolactate synthase, small subunit (ALS) [Polytomella parva]|mmetsp:Transcript_9198/g.17271  ORF Transcript_9198/g.17271 Transcript_9198/m.17271 type:complete len:673 (+) Transcript_9198:48-2066(+)|eukprot:CAMPEP_0175055982 /NCGR_PEP_ID=MMETSP0052_2-20121109/10403_1 /TAXON_ID=51329 ORGANISM="Polytomella parva, Strain SAG 63-3" /NCGR_SAMPLE_ID=MMETSP0052_2 /ASSEMBLY_ACC=CAM_ASM_000194 /LENGTH=672 /DNA_ID=CAMNT_0016320929 /DNA_START=139 /DNA_END=2157 /DNA_ORIENTATION=+
MMISQQSARVAANKRSSFKASMPLVSSKASSCVNISKKSSSTRVRARLGDAPRLSPAEIAKRCSLAPASNPGYDERTWVDRFDGEPRKGADILVQSLEREGVDTVFAYPGGASMEIHQALTRSNQIANILCRHEQGEIFAAEGFAKASGKVGVCIATSGPGATNLVTGLADAMMDSIPLVAITGQVPRRMIGTDGFQETPIVEVTRAITKHNYLVLDIADIPRVVKEAFFLARSGRPGPVLVDIPKDIQQQLAIPEWDISMSVTSYISRLPALPELSQLIPVLRAIQNSCKPVIYYGGGCLDAKEELRELASRTGIPLTSTLMGIGVFPKDHPQSLQMLGMHGTVVANYAVDQADLLIALGVRFDDRVTGKLESFARHAKIVHIDIDAAEIGKNKLVHVPLCSDVKPALQLLNKLLEGESLRKDAFAAWRAELDATRQKFPMKYPVREDAIVPQLAIEVLGEETKGEAIITTGVGQHQMFAAQWYPYKEPRRWISSGGLGSMGFGLPAALGAAAAFDGKKGRPSRVVVDIDGDGSFLMNCQELATIFIEKLNCKVLLLNNQHLGMVVQWEDRFYKANRAHTYLGKRESEWHETHKETDIYPDFVKMADSFNVPARRVIKKDELRAAIREMLDTPGPYLLEVMVPHIEHVLPMIPGGASFREIITEGDGSIKY